MRSFALADIEGHGELCKSSLPSEIALNMAFSVSEKKKKKKKIHTSIVEIKSEQNTCSDSKISVFGLVTCISL